MNFQQVDEILRNSFCLSEKTSKSGKLVRHSYYYPNRYLHTRKSEVAREVVQHMNGGVGGYIYAGHLPEFDNHPKRHKDGYLNIGHMNEMEFIEVTTKVTREYK